MVTSFPVWYLGFFVSCNAVQSKLFNGPARSWTSIYMTTNLFRAYAKGSHYCIGCAVHLSPSYEAIHI